MANQITFYTHPQSRGCIVRWMLEELGVSYKTNVLEYGEPLKAPDYLALNPMGKVPSLVHDQRVVTEAAAICVYLAHVFPDTGLSPQDDDERARYYRWMFFSAGPMESVVVNKTIFGEQAAEDKQQIQGYGNYQLVLNALSEAIMSYPYIAGDRFTAADVYIGTQLMWRVAIWDYRKA
ncbi:glutathione S-transferase family protein [Microbulbifer sp. GL-2]|uniref:glutathione S-transferase family protein n=1 Tax=Microbulbifer sp. GL-2 TaxID=2591606 RepID=UPI0011630341|nr:glutathione S-transferase family protein [Microbulbifer sp. GL-2]BBM01318.1 glutathione S-transferase [Microbulbifer sp. GL-2]